MTFGLDTSFIIRLLTGAPTDQAAKAQEWMERCQQRGVRPKVSDIVIVEAYFALQTHYHVPKEEALGALRLLLESGDVEPVGFALEVLRDTPNLAKAKPGFVDRIIHAEARSTGSQLLIFEKAVARLAGTKVL
jgi:predicted nucleic acid-binding protein